MVKSLSMYRINCAQFLKKKKRAKMPLHLPLLTVRLNLNVLLYAVCCVEQLGPIVYH